jgi:hypothetical protein
MWYLTTDELSQIISKVVWMHNYQGVKFGWFICLTHLLFIDDILIFYLCYDSDAIPLNDSLALFCGAKGMVINLQNYSI